MSNKPPKKGDLKKRWMTPRRDREIMMAPEYHLIVSEGTKTEPNYFEAFKNEINKKFPGRISIDIEGVGEGTIKLLERAQKIVGSSPNEYKHVWLVYDKDDFPPEDFDITAAKCTTISDSNVTYHALWSNECIEYWFLLHFEYLQSAICRKKYYPKLSKHLGFKYQKNSDKIYDTLKPNLETAIKNAKKIEESYRDLQPSQCAPGTKVYELFEMLIKYISQ